MKAAFEVGYDVYRPAIEGGRYDLILDTGDALVRVQCKWASTRKGVIVVRAYSARRTRDGLLQRPYVEGECDAFGVYSAQLGRCYLIPFTAIAGHAQVSLRVDPPRNNQRLRIRSASRYEFGARLIPNDVGPIAQLGERQRGTLEVA